MAHAEMRCHTSSAKKISITLAIIGRSVSEFGRSQGWQSAISSKLAGLLDTTPDMAAITVLSHLPACAL